MRPEPEKTGYRAQYMCTVRAPERETSHGESVASHIQPSTGVASTEHRDITWDMEDYYWSIPKTIRTPQLSMEDYHWSIWCLEPSDWLRLTAKASD